MTCGLARLNVTVGEPGRGVAVSVLCLCFQGFEILFIGIGPGDPVFKGLLVDSMAILICEVDLEIVNRSEKFHNSPLYHLFWECNLVVQILFICQLKGRLLV